MNISNIHATNLTHMPSIVNEDGYKRLAVAVVERAIEDLQYDLERVGEEKAWKKFSPFFMSDYFTLLVDTDGEGLLKQLFKNFRETGCVYKWKGYDFYGKKSGKDS